MSRAYYRHGEKATEVGLGPRLRPLAKTMINDSGTGFHKTPGVHRRVMGVNRATCAIEERAHGGRHALDARNWKVSSVFSTRVRHSVTWANG